MDILSKADMRLHLTNYVTYGNNNSLLTPPQKNYFLPAKIATAKLLKCKNKVQREKRQVRERGSKMERRGLLAARQGDTSFL